MSAHGLWYHTIELPGGVVTPGAFDLRPVLGRMPWPDVRGKRCLDVGTYDGFLAFELERRGASEVVATDVAEHEHWDWPVRMRALGPERLEEIAGEKGAGFRIAAEALGSGVQREQISIYDLDPERIGSFDVVVCGSLLLHLRDPVGALEAVRGVCSGRFLSAEHIDLRLSVRHPRRALGRLRGGSDVQWWVPNAACHRAWLRSAGFEVERSGPIYAIPTGEAHPPPGGGVRAVVSRALTRAWCRGPGVPHAAVLARPAP